MVFSCSAPNPSLIMRDGGFFHASFVDICHLEIASCSPEYWIQDLMPYQLQSLSIILEVFEQSIKEDMTDSI
jgi:hypothetical protein